MAERSGGTQARRRTAGGERLTREETQARTRASILQAAREVFAREGYARASIDLVAAEAGYTKGAVYANFASKDALFLELLREHKAREIAGLRMMLEEAENADAVLSVLGARMRALNEDGQWALLAVELHRHAARNADVAREYAELQREHRVATGEMIATLFRRAGKRLPAPAGQLATALKALAQGLALEQPAPGATGEEAVPADDLLALVLTSLVNAAEPAGEDDPAG